MTNVSTQAGGGVPVGAANDFVDLCAFHDWQDTATLIPYMDDAWRELLERRSDPFGAARTRVKPRFVDPRGSWAPGTYPEKGLPGSDLATLQAHLLGDAIDRRVVLGYDEVALVTGIANHYIGQQVTRAANIWTREEWLERDPRLSAYILISSALPDEAAKEIRRAAVHDRMVGVHMGINVLGKPLGNPLYHPIYAAAAEAGLPIVLQVGSDGNSPDQFNGPAGGPIATMGEFRALEAGSLASHVVSLIAQGVFDKFPDLQLLLVGGGLGWIADTVWRADYRLKTMGHEVPWLRKQIEEYFVEHVTLTTFGLEVPSARELEPVLASVPGIEQKLAYASGYPSRDWQKPEEAVALLGEFATDRVFRGAAEDFLGDRGATLAAAKEQ